jgi:inward rectifier potassium channel
MALGFKHKVEAVKNSGFGNNADAAGGRLVNKDGTANTKKTGLGFFEHNSWYHTLLKISLWKFILFIFINFFIANIIFTIIYYVVGTQHLNGITSSSSFEEISKVFYFSVQTFTTVGYGHISPGNFAASTVSGIEAFCGLLFFALATGLLYGRFSKPDAFIRFSKNALVAPFNGATAVMIRLVPFKNNNLIDAEVKLSLALINIVDGKRKTEFYPLKTEIDKINSLVLSWTVVHPINEESPLYGFTEEAFNASLVEVIVFIKAFDETFSNTVIAKTSYTFNEIIHGAKFVPMFHRDNANSSTIIEIDKLNDFEMV